MFLSHSDIPSKALGGFEEKKGGKQESKIKILYKEATGPRKALIRPLPPNVAGCAYISRGEERKTDRQAPAPRAGSGGRKGGELGPSS